MIGSNVTHVIDDENESEALKNNDDNQDNTKIDGGNVTHVIDDEPYLQVRKPNKTTINWRPNWPGFDWRGGGLLHEQVGQVICPEMQGHEYRPDDVFKVQR